MGLHLLVRASNLNKTRATGGLHHRRKNTRKIPQMMPDWLRKRIGQARNIPSQKCPKLDFGTEVQASGEPPAWSKMQIGVGLKSDVKVLQMAPDWRPSQSDLARKNHLRKRLNQSFRPKCRRGGHIRDAPKCRLGWACTRVRSTLARGQTRAKMRAV